ncbi:MAG: response regulator [Defluviitaleaceae bacterium]|nr:response regulator [Defluviitaleaceae bacterium]
MQKTVFVVDDNDTNLAAAKDALKGHYRVMTLPSAGKLFSMMEKLTPDLILLDIEMPEMDGFEALTLLKNNNPDVPVIFLTSLIDAEVEVRGFQLGVIDFITKPFSAPVLVNRIKTHLDIDGLIRERTRQIQKLQNGVVSVVADMVESRDNTTGGHIERTSEYLHILIDAMIDNDMCTAELKSLDLDMLISSARLHDVGKVCISDMILNKPGRLTEEEFTVMKTHAAEGERIINQMGSRTENVEFLHNAKLFAGTHHERWDGKGYPNGLNGKNIPLQGRIMALVDVYDALVFERPYKKAFPHEEAVKIIMDGKGTQFDPDITDLFFKTKDKFEAVKV